MADSSFSVTSSKSWGSRIVSSLTGIIIGILLIPGSIFLLSWNENNSVKTERSLAEGAAAVVHVALDKVDSANNAKLVHLSGDAVTKEGVSDVLFQISASALALHRKVEMFQWKESESSKNEKKLGGGSETVTTYTYSKEWDDDLLDSSQFKRAQDHTNPTEMIAKSRVFLAPDVTIGAFTIPEGIVSQMGGEQPITPTEEDFAKLPGNLKDKAQLTASGIYFGKDPAAATIGDQRVTFEIVWPGPFSILAQQTGETFQPYPTKAGKEIERVESGTVSAALMFQHARSENSILTWILRLLGFIVMFIGFALILKPISVIGDVIPFIGNVLGAGTGLIAVLLAMIGTLVTVAVAWLAVRPLLGGSLIAIAFVVLLAAFVVGSRRPKKTL